MIDTPQPIETRPRVLQFKDRLGRIDILRTELEELIARRARIDGEEDGFISDFLERFGPAVMPLTNNGTVYVIVRPSRRGNITRVGRLASTLIFRDAEGKIIPLVEHVDYKVFNNPKGARLDREGFDVGADWLQSVLDEIDQLPTAA